METQSVAVSGILRTLQKGRQWLDVCLTWYILLPGMSAEHQVIHVSQHTTQK